MKIFLKNFAEYEENITQTAEEHTAAPEQHKMLHQHVQFIYGFSICVYKFRPLPKQAQAGQTHEKKDLQQIPHI